MVAKLSGSKPTSPANSSVRCLGLVMNGMDCEYFGSSIFGFGEMVAGGDSVKSSVDSCSADADWCFVEEGLHGGANALADPGDVRNRAAVASFLLCDETFIVAVPVVVFTIR